MKKLTSSHDILYGQYNPSQENAAEEIERIHKKYGIFPHQNEYNPLSVYIKEADALFNKTLDNLPPNLEYLSIISNIFNKPLDNLPLNLKSFNYSNNKLLNINDIKGVIYDFPEVGDFLAKHSHEKDTVHITIVARGKLIVRFNDKEEIISAGDIYNWAIGEQHEFEAIEPNSRIVNIQKFYYENIL